MRNKLAINLSIAKDFSETPGPRSREEGKFSGDEFREEVLQPAFLKAIGTGQLLEIDMDGAVGYATSFLESAFGGLAREYDPGKIIETIRLTCKDEPSLVNEVVGYIREARDEKVQRRLR